MSASGVMRFRSHGVAFLLGMSVALGLAMCSDAGGASDSQQAEDVQAQVDALEAALAELQATVEALDADVETLNGQSHTVYWQQNVLTGQLSSSATDIADLHFDNLEAGKTYRLSISSSIESGNTQGILSAIHDSTTIARSQMQSRDASGEIDIQSQSVIFTATAEALTFDFSTGGGFLNVTYTYAILEELPHHSETTVWE